MTLKPVPDRQPAREPDVPQPDTHSPIGAYPTTRMRRNRRNSWNRRLVAENRLAPDDLIWPIFVHNGDGVIDVASMPSQGRLSIDVLVTRAREACDLGIPMIAVFPVIPTERKNAEGSEAINPDNLVCRAVAAIKQAVPEIGVMCDAALDPFTNHGHDGLIRDGYVINDETVEILCQQALVQAAAGCDVISPSDMMDGRVGAIRKSLDDHGYDDVRIMAYSAKYASAFYGPFRDAIGSTANLGDADKKTYQMDPANGDEAIREVALDIQEGADMVMVKPALAYLDVIAEARAVVDVPLAAYHVSGEYAMVEAAAANGWLDGDAVGMEHLLSIRRAGADFVLTYLARRAAELLGS